MLKWLLDPAVLACGIIAALLLTFADSVTTVGTSAPLRWLVRVPLALIATEYSLLLMRHAANGHRAPASMELNHLRFIHGSGLVLLALLWLVGRSHWRMTAVGMVPVPAVLAGYAMEKPLLRLLNPVDWIRTYVGFGPCLLTLAVMTALLIAVVHGAADPDRSRFFRYWLLLNAPAAWLIVLGRCVFERRLEMNFEPIHAPERAADRQRITDRAQVGRFLDALYVAVRNNDRPRIDVLMTDHLTALDAAARAHDAELVMQRLHVWGEGAGSAYVRSLLAKQFAPTEEQRSTSRD